MRDHRHQATLLGPLCISYDSDCQKIHFKKPPANKSGSIADKAGPHAMCRQYIYTIGKDDPLFKAMDSNYIDDNSK